MPALTVLVKVEIFAPLDQVVDFIIKFLILQLLELPVIERVIVEGLKLILESCTLDGCLIDCVALVCDKLCILRVSVELAKPADLSISALLGRLLLPELRNEVELFRFFTSLNLNFVIRCENLVRDGTPAVALNPLVPAIVIVVLGPVKCDVDCVLPLILLHGVVVARSERIDVHDATVCKDLVVDQRWEPITSKTEANVTARCSIQETSLCWINTLQQLHRLTPAKMYKNLLSHGRPKS